MVVYLLCQVPFHSFHFFNQLDPRWTFGGGLGWVGVCVQYTSYIGKVMKVFDIRSGLDVAPDRWQNWFWQVLVCTKLFFFAKTIHIHLACLSVCRTSKKRKRTCKGTQAHAREHSPNTLSRHPLMLMSKANAPGPCTGNVYQSLMHFDPWETWIGWIQKKQTMHRSLVGTY